MRRQIAPSTAATSARTARMPISFRRSIRSDSQPIGILQNQPAGIDHRDKQRDLLDAQPRERTKHRRHAELRRKHPAEQKDARPRTAARPRSGVSAASTWFRENSGVWVTDNRIGANEIDTRTEGMTKSSQPDGSPQARMACAETMPIIWAIR